MKISHLRGAIISILMLMLCSAVLAEPPGQMIDIGGRQLHVIATSGDGPTVVLEAGGGAYSSFWHQVQAGIRDDLGLRVISYDRAGLGWSDPGSLPYRILDKANDLDALLSALGVDTPIILVATSYGGWVAQAFASIYPERVAAIVLVEPNSAHFFEQYPAKVAKIEADGEKQLARGLKRLGLKMQRNWFAKHVGTPRSYFDPILTDRHQAALGHMLLSFGATLKLLSEIRFPDVPTVMISRGRPQGRFPWGDTSSESAWLTGHEQLIAHLSNRQHWIAEESAHAVVIDQPDLVVKAVAAVMTETVIANSRSE